MILTTPSEVKKISNNVFLYDDLFSIDRKRLYEFCDKLKTMFESQHTQTEIDKKKIRLKMEDFKDKVVYYVDQNGIVLKNNSESFKLEKSEMDTIEQGIIYFSGVVDCKVVTE